MERKFKLSCESTVDLSYEYITGRGIAVLFYTYSSSSEVFIDNMQRDMEGLSEFYDKLERGYVFRTTQINEFTYYDYFDNLLKESDVLHVCLGSGMTPSYINALKAKELLTKKYPNRKLIVLDSLCSSAGYGLLVDICADMADRGSTMKEIENWVLKNRNKVHHQFFSTNNKYFKRSGRISGPTAFISTFLGICPIMRLNASGKIISYSKCRGVRRVIKNTIDTVRRNCQNGADYRGKMFVYHSNAFKLAKEVKRQIEEKFINLRGNVKITEIGNIIGSHCGPGTVAVSFLGSEREK